jgi:hypothetical protein
MIIHVDGSHTPGAPILPECVKADVYLPCIIINEHPEAHAAVAQIVQGFIEAIGIPTIHRWTRAGKKRGWSLSQSGHVYTQLAPTTRPLVPAPLSGTAHYQFYGRLYGSLSQSVTSNDSHTSNSESNLGGLASPHADAEPTMSQESETYGSESLSPTMIELADYIEEIAKLRAELEGAGLREDSFIKQIHALFDRLQQTDTELAGVWAQLAARNSPSFSSTISSISAFTSPPRSPEKPSPSKPNRWTDIDLVLPTLDSDQYPTHSSPLAHLPSRNTSSPPTRLPSRNADSPVLLFAPPPTPSSSCGRYRNNHDNLAAQAQRALGPYVHGFLQEHNLQEKLEDTLLLVHNRPLPAWFKLVNSLELTEIQRGELYMALVNDWSAGA